MTAHIKAASMRGAICLLTLAGLFASIPACAGDAPQSCDVPAYLLATESPLPKVGAAIKARGKLDILVFGSRSSTINPATLASPDGAYPGRLQDFMREKLPTIETNVTLEIQAKKTAEEAAGDLAKSVAAKKPDLVIWQTGTVDAMRGVDPDDFRTAIDESVAAMQAAGTDVILMNLQYSPRTETMISVPPYIDNMRVVAQQQDVPLFDRFAIMRHWSESGDFDLFSPSPSVDLAKRVHECLARALSTFVIDAAHINPVDLRIQR